MAVFLVSTSFSEAVTIDTVRVGNPGNAPDTEIMNDGTTAYGAYHCHFAFGFGIEDLHASKRNFHPIESAVDITGFRVVASLPLEPCDVNGDGICDVSDIDAMSVLIREGQTASDQLKRLVTDTFPDGFIDDGAANEPGRPTEGRDSYGGRVPTRLIGRAAGNSSWVGDANLDGELNSSDLIAVQATGTYEEDVDAGWASGDFDGSGRFDSGDLIFALADGGYEARPRAAAVPEPPSFLLFGMVIGLLIMCRKPVRRPFDS